MLERTSKLKFFPYPDVDINHLKLRKQDFIKSATPLLLSSSPLLSSPPLLYLVIQRPDLAFDVIRLVRCLVEMKKERIYLSESSRNSSKSKFRDFEKKTPIYLISLSSVILSREKVILSEGKVGRVRIIFICPFKILLVDSFFPPSFMV